MKLHRNAALSLKGRRQVCRRVVEEGWTVTEAAAAAELLPQITMPVTIITGRHDRVVPLVNAEFLHERLPDSSLVILDAGHFVWEEAPTVYASAVVDAITGNHS